MVNIYCFSLSLINTKAWRLRDIRVGQFKGVEGRVALVVPQQLVFQKPERFQRENNGFVFQEAVHVQP